MFKTFQTLQITVQNDFKMGNNLGQRAKATFSHSMVLHSSNCGILNRFEPGVEYEIIDQKDKLCTIAYKGNNYIIAKEFITIIK